MAASARKVSTMAVSSKSISSIGCLIDNAKRQVQCGTGARRWCLSYPAIPSASTQRASSERMAMCWGHARSQAPQPTHSLARLWPCSAFVRVGAYMCATCPINKLSPGDLNQRSFPEPSLYVVAPCAWFSSSSLKRSKHLSGYPMQAYSLGVVLAAKRVSE